MPEIDALFRAGLEHQRAGREAEAAAVYRQVLTSWPEHPGALHNLGVLAQREGRLDEAIALTARAAALDPGAPIPPFSLGLALTAAGRHVEAAQAFGQAFRRRPGLEPLRRHAAALRAAGRPEEAIAACREAVAAHPESAPLRHELATTLQAVGRLEEAEAVYQAVVAQAPSLVEGLANLGKVLVDLGRLAEAEPWYRRALELAPTRAALLNSLGSLCSMLGRHDEAVALLRQGLARRPGHAGTACNLAFALLRKGELREGWACYEARWRIPAMAAQLPACPRWRGEPLAGKSILLHAEQGLGDTLQFVRYVPLLARRGVRVVLECQAELTRLLARVEGVERVIARGAPRPATDLHCPLMSLPHVCGTTLENIPAAVPYLAADPGDLARWRAWRAAVAGDGNRLVGLVWAGQARPEIPDALAIDRRRSLDLAAFAPLGRVPGVRCVSLQKGSAAGQAISAPPGLDLLDPMDQVTDFADTAALIQVLDLVIAVDTSVPHLAAALGKPVWLLSRADACWRWLWDRPDSPWYPTLRLFRQPRPGAWAPVLTELPTALAAWAALEPPQG